MQMRQDEQINEMKKQTKRICVSWLKSEPIRIPI